MWVNEQINKSMEQDRVQKQTYINIVKFFLTKSKCKTMQQRQSNQQRMLEQLPIQIQKKKKRMQTQILHPQKLTQNRSDLNVRCKIIKLLKGKLGENLNDLGCGSNILDAIPEPYQHGTINILILDFQPPKLLRK